MSTKNGMTEPGDDAVADDPWGSAEPALTAGSVVSPLAGRLAVLDAVREQRELDPATDPELVAAMAARHADAAELPEVAALAAEGWRALEPAPVYVGVPAAWPTRNRGWVPDRLPHLAVIGPDAEGRQWVAPIDPAEQAEVAADWTDPAAADCGLPAPPQGRLWLLRSPWPAIGVEVLLTLGNARGHQTHPEALPQVALYRGLTELLSWSETALWDWWEHRGGPDPERARCARAWAARGRNGEDSAALVLARLSPTDLDTLTAPREQDGAELTEAQAVAWTRAAGPVERIVVWRRLGLPADPPPLRPGRLRELDPADVADWFADGFALADVDRLHSLGLTRAQTWRAAGFTADDVNALLGADPTLTPDEAAAFAAVGLPAAERQAWVAAGFDAVDARAYTDLEVYPGEARVWRAHGLGPDHARAQRRDGGGPLPDQAGELGWFAYGTTGDRAQRSYQVADPPGTRGRLAHEQRERQRRWPQ